MKQPYLIKLAVCLAFILVIAPAAHAVHPLITDEAETNGKGNFEIELNGEYGHERETYEGVSEKEEEFEVETEISYGIIDAVDVKVQIPYAWTKETVEDESEKADGIGDVSLSLKWRFLEKEYISLAVKPFLTLPTGEEADSLGTGRVTYGLYLITQTAIKKWEIYTNLGYLRNENLLDENKDLWHASLATEYEASEELSLVANIGIEKNRGKETDNDPAFIIGGIVYSLSEHISIDGGIKLGLTNPETDYAFLAGISFDY